MSGSFYGTFDQSGNVWQWNDLDGTAGSSRGFRGGNWYSYSSFASSSGRYDYDPSVEDDGVGYRLAGPPSSCKLPPGFQHPRCW